MIKRVAGVLLATLLITGAACTNAPREGTALELGSPALAESPARAGEFLIFNGVFIDNGSSHRIVLERIEPMGVDGADLVDILGIEVERRGQPAIGGGFYKTYPPAEYYARKDVCGIGRLFPVAGHELEPGAESRIAVALEVLDAPGRFRVGRWRIHYRDEDGDHWYQDSPFAVGLRIKEAGPPQEVFADERHCLKDVQSLRDAIEDGRYPGN